MATIPQNISKREKTRTKSAESEKVYRDKRLERLREDAGTIRLSFELLDLDHKYFNLGGICPKGINAMFKIMSFITKEITPERLRGPEFVGGKGTIRYHPHDDPKKITDWPPIISQESKDPEIEFCQIRFGKSYGGMHGLLIANIFYVIWLDPQHNMYPDDKYGGLKEYDLPGDCCKVQESLVSKLEEEAASMKSELDEYKSILEELTDPLVS